MRLSLEGKKIAAHMTRANVYMRLKNGSKEPARPWSTRVEQLM
jgi:hypothetical protein